MNIVCDFSISFDNEVEDVNLYNDDFTEDQVTDFLNRIIDENKIPIGERCEGSISVDDDFIEVESKFCSNVGEDWGDDDWSEFYLFKFNRESYDM